MTGPAAVVVPASQPVPPPPPGCAWQYVRGDGGGGLVLQAIPTVGVDPAPPPGCAWRKVTRRGVPVYLAEPSAFLGHRAARAWFGDDWPA